MSEIKKEANGAQASMTVSPENDFNNETIQKVSQIRVLVKRPGSHSGPAMIPNTLEALQFLVDGPIETVHLAKGVIIVLNELGKIRGLSKNFELPLIDFIVGTAVFLSSDGQGNFAGLTDDQIAYAERFIGETQSCR